MVPVITLKVMAIPLVSVLIQEWSSSSSNFRSTSMPPGVTGLEMKDWSRPQYRTGSRGIAISTPWERHKVTVSVSEGIGVSFAGICEYTKLSNRIPVDRRSIMIMALFSRVVDGYHFYFNGRFIL